ncbi:MAG: restriction endonuclease subunit S, partial [Chlorobium sp.]
MKTVQLGSLITISKGKKHTVSEVPSPQSIRMLGIDDLRNDTLIRMTDDKDGVLACDDDVLIAWDGANAGTIGYGKRGYIGSTISRLRLHDTSKFYAPFIGIFLQSNFSYLRQTATGATIPHINRNALERIPVPVFAYDDQVRIATLLFKVENLIFRRREQLKQLDELLKSVFLEMFGLHNGDVKKWIIEPLSTCTEIVSGV